MHSSSIVGLCSDVGASFERDAISTSCTRFDQPFSSQLLENNHRAIGKQIAFTRVAFDFADASVFAQMANVAALRQHVKHALFNT